MLKRFLLSVIALVVCSTGVFAQDVFVTFGQGVNVGNTSATFNGAGSGTGFIFVRNGFGFDAFDFNLTSSNNAVAQITSATVVNSSLEPFGFSFIVDSASSNNAAVQITSTPAVNSIVSSFPTIRFANPDVDLNGNGVVDSFADGNGNTVVETGDINSIPGFIDASGIANFRAGGGFSPFGGLGNTGGPIISIIDTGFDVDADAFLLGTFDFNIVGNGTTTFELQLSDDPSFAGPTGFLTVPEGVSLDLAFGDGATLTATGVAVPEPSSAVLLALGLVGLAARRRRERSL